MLFFMTFTAEESKKFTTIFKQHYKKLVCKARTILFSYDLAEDAVEEAFIRALNNLDKIMELNEPRRLPFCSVPWSGSRTIPSTKTAGSCRWRLTATSC